MRERNFLFLLIIIICACCFVYLSPYFERKKPHIDVPSISYWNLKWNVPVKISDESGIKSYSVILKDKNTHTEKILLEADELDSREIEFNLPIPRQNILSGDVLSYKIIAHDNSKWRFFLGNVSEIEFDVEIDTSNPEVRIIAMSNKISKGGSAAIVLYARDNALADISISNGYQNFVAFPFLRENYYVGIIPWFIHNPTFKGSIIVRDRAGNTKKSNIGFTRYSRNYRVSTLNLKDDFIYGKIAELIEDINEYPLESFKTPLSMFRYINENIRQRDENMISSKILNLSLWDTANTSTEISAFKPIKDGVIVGLFGDHRKYVMSKDKSFAGESYHLGTDLANVKNMQVVASNDGIVVMSEELGIYGNTIMIDHGYGITSLYSHLSDRYVEEGEYVTAGDIIGRTGASGLAFGDHLHFAILLQGNFVLSTEWMDSKWLKTNINDVLLEAKEIIENR